MKAKVTSNNTLNENGNDRLHKVLINNMNVFDNKLRKCNSYIHTFQVTDQTPFNRKCRIIPLSLVHKRL